jgi:hypothetical protein
MLRQVRDLRGLTIAATDGDIGRAHDLYLDDHRWTVRSLVVDTRPWPAGRRVLISPHSVFRADWPRRRLEVALTKEEIRRRPDIDTDQPVAGRPAVSLRRARRVAGYALQALDGEVGHIHDFVIDDETWVIRYLVAETRDWWPGKKVLVPREWIAWVSWLELKVHVDLRREILRHAPEYDPTRPIQGDDEARLGRYYGRPKCRAFRENGMGARRRRS